MVLAHGQNGNAGPATTGKVLHWEAWAYDLLTWLLLLGRVRACLEGIIRLAGLQLGEAVLDIGCGTGSLAIAARRHVGAAGTVHGIDASPEMIAGAITKANKAGLDVVFQEAVVEALPFPDARFDVVLSTLMLHHLPREARRQCAREVRRVLKPGGRLLAVDFVRATEGPKTLIGHIHRHGGLQLSDLTTVLSDAGLRVADTGAVGIAGLRFVRAVRGD
jgi:ubiquinone/menaquinone biosynthesis C-methylase UbiE